MAKGDAKCDLQPVTAGSSLTIRPVSGEEWNVRNFFWGGSVDFKIAGTAVASGQRIDQDTSSGGRLDQSFYLTNAHWIIITNTAGVTINIGYNGVQTK